MKSILFVVTSLISALLLANSVYAETNITHLRVKGNLLLISTSTEKTHTLPSCVSLNPAAQWAIDISTDKGRASLVLANTALSSGLLVEFESAGVCVGNSGIENAKNVVLVAPSNP